MVELKGNKDGNFFIYQHGRFESMKRRFKRFNIPFKTEEYTSVRFIETNLKKYRFTMSNKRIPGIHIANCVLLNTRKRMDSGEYVCKNKDNNRQWVKTIYYNEKVCFKSKGIAVVAIDINSCYFNTAYNIGVIDEKTYKTGFKKNNEYKVARNVSIGCLGKNCNIVEYNGYDEKAYLQKSDMACARLDIIDYVYNVSLKISNALRGGFLMYLTDCYFVLPEYAERCKALIEKAGYTCKQKNILITDCYLQNRRKFKIEWQNEGESGISFHSFDRVKHELSENKDI